MSLKRSRVHLSGISNIDFRTKGEIEEIKKYQPYHESKNFGMLGLGNYKLPYSIHKELFKPTIGINEGKYVENNIQNPKIYESSLFYQKNYMNIKPRAILSGERAKQLDTSDHRGGEEYNGDSMMICEINKQRKETKIREKLIQENLRKKHIGVISGRILEKTDIINKNLTNNKENDKNINKEKNENILNNDKNNEKELKLVKNKSEGSRIFLDNKVSKERLNIIRNKIFNRLKTHNNTKEIFLKWQKNYLNNRELSLYDLHGIINDLGISISFNEAFALIKSANKRNTDKLNYDEFKSLFLNDDKNIDIDLSKIPYQNESSYKENIEKEEENKRKQLSILRVSKGDNYLALQKIIRICYPNFLETMKKIQKENAQNNNKELKGICDLPTFKKVLDTIKIPDKFKNESIINTIYNQYKLSDNMINYEKFIENCKNIKETNDFFIFQNGYLNLIQKKLEKNENERKKYNDILVMNKMKKKEYLKELGNQIGFNSIEDIKMINRRLYKNKSLCNINHKNYFEINKNKKYTLEDNNDDKNEINEYNNAKTINTNFSNNKTEFYNHYQPSFNFIDFVFKDNKIYNDRYYKAIDDISPLIPKKTNDRNDVMKRNFSDLGEYKHRNLVNSKKFNKNFLSSDVGGPGYMKSEERYEKYEPSQGEKKKKLLFLENSLKRKYDTNKKWNDKFNFQQQVVNINNSLGQIKRTENLLRYEKKMNDINNIGI